MLYWITFSNKEIFKKLSEEQLHHLNSPIKDMKVLLIIDSLPNNKPPGLDGFTGEYYKTVRQFLVPQLVKIFGSAAASSSFHPKMLKALIVALPKPGKAPDTPQYFRSIWLLNNDLKIYAKLLATRLVDILPIFTYSYGPVVIHKG